MTVLTRTEKKTKKRMDNVQEALNLLDVFFDKGFSTLPAISTLIRSYYPDVTKERITNFWHFRNVSDDMIAKVSSVLDQLNKE
ncbi:MAG: hypothetical protein BM557_09645 [Flavobacterium sp. MedPE-SWcel]|uniref:hypothetical protein n=1 Tax=uncultured Flavobacterium sp. TaxID=165435 RepID=UPI000910662D|nr:hypothetical protein [uncultured Flavobacterium sp.]OIQ16567.1 MAG: hypothetical protein BM557_09645 [Flavobacterium sp. MedPE-SWcel]